MLLAGDALDWRDAEGEPVVDDSFLLLLNGSHDNVEFTMPSLEWGSRWSLCIDTARDIAGELGDLEIDAKTRVPLKMHSMMVFKRTSPGRGSWRQTRSVRGGF
jgi:glycogen operon protein